MDAEEVEHVSRNQQQGLHCAGVDRRLELPVQSRHRLGGEVRRDRPEPHDRPAVCAGLRDVVVRGFPSPAAAGDELKQVAVELQHDVRRKPDVVGVRVDRAEHLAIARDLLLRAVRWTGAAGDEGADPIRWRNHPLDPIGGLGALDDRVRPQRLQDLRGLLFEQRLFPAILADEPDAPHQPLIDGLPAEPVFVEGFRHELDHNITS